jgi:hypothetical protein
VGLEWGPLSLSRIIEELGKTSGSGFRKSRLTAVGDRRADHAAPSIRKGWYLLKSGGRSVGTVHLQTKSTEFKYCHLVLSYYYLCIIIIILYYDYYHLLLYCHIINYILLYSNYYINIMY